MRASEEGGGSVQELVHELCETLLRDVDEEGRRKVLAGEQVGQLCLESNARADVQIVRLRTFGLGLMQVRTFRWSCMRTHLLTFGMVLPRAMCWLCPSPLPRYLPSCFKVAMPWPVVP